MISYSSKCYSELEQFYREWRGKGYFCLNGLGKDLWESEIWAEKLYDNMEPGIQKSKERMFFSEETTNVKSLSW